jgi:ribosomal-protein-alanine N-acetyltransferase
MEQRLEADLFLSENDKNNIAQILEIHREGHLSVWTFEDYIQELRNDYSLILVAKSGQKIIGFLASRLLLKNQTECDEEDSPAVYSEAEILNFGVLKNYRAQGVGSVLLNKLLQNVSHLLIDTIWLDVRISNLTAINFYSNRGFIKVEKRKNFYNLPAEDAVVMKLSTIVPDEVTTGTKLDSITDFEVTSLRNPK